MAESPVETDPELPPASKTTWLALAVLFAALACDFALVRLYWGGFYGHSALRIALAVATIVFVARLSKLSRRDLGLRLETDLEWARLVRGGLIGALLFCCLFASVIPMVAKHRPLALDAVLPRPSVLTIFDYVLLAPLVEEPLYRVALCPTVERALGQRIGIGVSGIAFGALHVHYGTAGITNLLAGFVLGWLFYRSRSALVPALVHGVGNGLLLALSAFYRAVYGVSDHGVSL